MHTTPVSQLQRLREPFAGHPIMTPNPFSFDPFSLLDRPEPRVW